MNRVITHELQKHFILVVFQELQATIDAVILRPATLHKSLEFFESIIHLCNTDAFRNAIVENEDRRDGPQVLRNCAHTYMWRAGRNLQSTTSQTSWLLNNMAELTFKYCFFLVALVFLQTVLCQSKIFLIHLCT